MGFESSVAGAVWGRVGRDPLTAVFSLSAPQHSALALSVHAPLCRIPSPSLCFRRFHARPVVPEVRPQGGPPVLYKWLVATVLPAAREPLLERDFGGDSSVTRVPPARLSSTPGGCAGTWPGGRLGHPSRWRSARSLTVR